MPNKIDEALVHHRAGRLADAEALYRRAIASETDAPEALRLLGIVRTQQGRHDEALALVSEAVKRDPGAAKGHATLGTVLHALFRHEEAIVSFDNALAIQPQLSEAHYNRGISLDALGRHAEAIASYDAALSIRPDFAEALASRGNALQALGRHAEAMVSYDKALGILPNLLQALNNRGATLDALGRHEEALATYEKALEIQPDFVEVLKNRGITFHRLDRCAEAVASFDAALAIKPDSVDVLTHRGNALHSLGRHAEALASYERAIAIDPDHAEARWSLTMFQLPAVSPSESYSEGQRAAFAVELEHLDRWFAADRLAAGFNAVGAQQPFFLAYQEENNRDLLQRYGKLCARIMADWLKRQSVIVSAPPTAPGPIRIGVVTRYFHNQSVWNAIVKGWFARFDPSRISLLAFHLGPVEDEDTLFARSRAAHFEQGKRELRNWVETIVAQRPEVLIYPEIGMDTMTVKLASMRLAPVQVATWGHPETTGLPTIDYFLSAEDMEPDNAQDNYTERLVTLPHLGCFYSPRGIDAHPVDLNAWGIDAKLPLLLCPGVPFKYAPRHDGAIAQIARRLGRCQIVFFTHQSPGLSDLLARRLRDAFVHAGLELDEFVTFIPSQTQQSFYGLLKRADVYLDTVGFSGFNTAIQAVECGLPVVTREGRFLRGRLASGILKRIGLEELVARSENEYIELAVRLSQDSEFREQMRNRIEQNRAVLFEDESPIRALEDFLVKARRIEPPVNT